MGKFDGILICTDLDGTLLNSERAVSRENIEAIEYFKKEGGLFTFVTGRMPFFVYDIYNAVRPNAPIGCVNGGGIFDYSKNEYVYKAQMPRSVLELVEAAALAIEGLGIQINSFDHLYFAGENQAMKDFRKITGVPNLQKYYYDVDEPIAKIVFGDNRIEVIERLAKLLSEHPRASEFDFIRSELTLYEILPKGINKGSVLPILTAHLGISPSRTIALGDYDNDVQMLKSAALGIAVSNASPTALAVADRVTVSNDEHAIAKVIDDIDKSTSIAEFFEQR